MEEIGNEPIIKELEEKVIDGLEERKASGKEGIPPEACICAGNIPIEHFLRVSLLVLESGIEKPCHKTQEMLTLTYKDKFGRSDCSNYRGMSILGTTGRLFAGVIHTRLQKGAERSYSEVQ